MKTKTVITVLLVAVILASCVPAAKVVPTETAVPTSTFTPIPKATSTVTSVPSTPTFTPTPPIETLAVTQKSVSQFATTMQKAGINITAEQILQQRLEIQTIAGADGKQYKVATVYLDPDPNQQGETLEGNYPLVIKTENGWEEANSKILAHIKGIKLGVLVGLYPGSPDFNKLQDVQSKYFNSALINVNWGNLQPTNADIDFQKSGLDWSVNFAKKNNMNNSLGLSLVWAADAPNWLKTGTFSRDELISIMTNHIKAVMTRYKGKVSAWGVVNEPYNAPYITNDVFKKVIGDEYIEIAFQAAREADPSAKLVFNNDLNYTAEGITTKRSLEIVQRLKEKGLIDAVGVQMHINGSQPLPSEEDVIKTLQSYGLPVMITEFDVNMMDVKGNTV